MSIEELGSLGELIAAIATLATLAYLAIQVRQNTRALRAATFQQVSEAMAQNVSHLVDHPDLAEIGLKATSDPDQLTPEEIVRYQGLMLMSVRRLEAIYLQNQLGSIDADLVQGFEMSLISLLNGPVAARWWKSAQRTFHPSFVAHVESRLASGDVMFEHPSLRVAHGDQASGPESE